jgi:hypothetical protein
MIAALIFCAYFLLSLLLLRYAWKRTEMVDNKWSRLALRSLAISTLYAPTMVLWQIVPFMMAVAMVVAGLLMEFPPSPQLLANTFRHFVTSMLPSFAIVWGATFVVGMVIVKWKMRPTRKTGEETDA